MKRALGLGSSWAIVLLASLTFGGACDRSEQVRSTLETDRAVWQQRISSLKARTGTLRQKVGSLPAQATTTPMARVAQRRRVEALAVGSEQSLNDLERAVADGARDVEAALGRGDGDAEQTLAAITANIDGYLQQQDQNVTAAEAALAQLEGTR